MKEKRYFRCEFQTREESESGEMIAVGKPILYNNETVLYKSASYVEKEVIESGAASEAIKGDVRAVWGHDNNIVLGRTASGTLILSEDADGINAEIHFPDSHEGRSKFESIKRGDVSGMSFAFIPTDIQEERTEENDVMTILTRIKKMDVFEVSPVAFPAYADTEIYARAEKRASEFKGTPKDSTAAAVKAHEVRQKELDKEALI